MRTILWFALLAGGCNSTSSNFHGGPGLFDDGGVTDAAARDLGQLGRDGGETADLATTAEPDLAMSMDMAAPIKMDDMAAPTNMDDMAVPPMPDLAMRADLAPRPTDLAKPPSDLAQSPPDLAQAPPDLAARDAFVLGCHPLINEILTGTTQSADEEYIELYNPCGAFDLMGWKVGYRSAANFNPAAGPDSVTLFTFGMVTLAPKGYFVLGGNTYAGPHDVSYNNGALAAAGGGIGLRDPNANLIESVGYGTATNAFVEVAAAPAPMISNPPGSTIGRLPNGTDTKNNANDFKPTALPTPGAANQ